MMDGWGWMWGAVMMVLFWAGVVAVIVWIVRAPRGRASQGPDGSADPDARTILENRFALGEISEEEFEQRKKVLASSRR